jgi:hypothetical protein
MSSDANNKNGDGSYLVKRRTALKYALCGAVGVVAAALTADQAQAGYGQCSVSGCPCRGFMGSGGLCGNCGHQYGAHW